MNLPHSLDRGRHVAEATRTPWIADLAGTTPGGNVRPNAMDGERLARSSDFRSDVRFVLAEAIADGSESDRLFLPCRHAHIPFREREPILRKVHHVTGRIGAKTIERVLETAQCRYREQRLDRQCIDWRTRGLARAARDRFARGAGLWATALSHVLKYQPWSVVQSQAP